MSPAVFVKISWIYPKSLMDWKIIPESSLKSSTWGWLLMYAQRPIRLEDIPGMEHRMQFLGICLLTEIKEYPSPYWINSLNMIILLAVITLPNWILYLDSISINVISAPVERPGMITSLPFSISAVMGSGCWKVRDGSASCGRKPHSVGTTIPMDSTVISRYSISILFVTSITPKARSMAPLFSFL